MTRDSVARHRLALWLGLAATLAALPSSTASAQGGVYVGVGVGPAVRIDDWPTQVRLEQEIGVYVSGAQDGFFIAFAPSQSFTNHIWILTFAPRFGYMFQLHRGRDVMFQLGPTGTIPGIALVGCYDNLRCDADVYFHFSVSLALRLLLARGRVAIYLRPVEFEFAFGDRVSRHSSWNDDAIRYVLEGGLQFHL